MKHSLLKKTNTPPQPPKTQPCKTPHQITMQLNQKGYFSLCFWQHLSWEVLYSLDASMCHLWKGVVGLQVLRSLSVPLVKRVISSIFPKRLLLVSVLHVFLQRKKKQRAPPPHACCVIAAIYYDSICFRTPSTFQGVCLFKVILQKALLRKHAIA